MLNIEIPQNLISQIEEGNCVLVFGPKSNVENPNHIQIGSRELSNEIAKKFLDETYLDESIEYTSDLAVANSSLLDFQKYISSIYISIKSSKYQQLLPTFTWKAIFTTNYDTSIESSYSNSNRIQDLAVVIKDSNQQDVFINSKSLPFYKLHGCINYLSDESIPFILTPNHYSTHRSNRERMFTTLKELSYNYTFIFIGFNISHQFTRAILNEIRESLSKRPRAYLISNDIREADIKLWNLNKIEVIKKDFDSFFNEINKRITLNNRILAKLRPKVDHPIFNKFTVNTEEIKPTKNLLEYINEDIEFIHRNFITETTKPEAFYKGYFENWDPIRQNLDAQRNLTDSIISEVIIEETYSKNTPQNFILIKGFAGSGKSVLIKRLAWNAAVMFDKLCIFLKPGSRLSYEPLAELYKFTQERIYFFIDGVAGRDENIKIILEKSKNDNLEITLICTERINVWNTDCSSLEKYLTQDYKLKYLNDREINSLLDLLERHKCLGMLERKTKAERVEELSQKANRELLVALYEATQSKPFEVIIRDEYEKINSEAAKQMYLTICILHRLGSSARAGLISRVHGITLTDFKERLFKPLEFIVFDKEDNKIRDFIYLTRHKQIADIVFETVLKTTQERFDEYIRVLACLNLDFENDRVACYAMTNAKKLMQIFNDSFMIRRIYDVAEEKNPDSPKIKQQRAIYEMNSIGGSLDVAEKLLKSALLKLPKDSIIWHSFAELSFRKAERSGYIIEQNKFLQESVEICQKLLKKQSDSSYAYNTLLKVILFKLKREVNSQVHISIESIVKDFEKNLSNAKQQNPLDETLLGIEASFNEVFDNKPEAKALLKRAYDINPASPYISIRLSSIYKNNNETNDAVSILEKTANLLPNDKEVNFKLAMVLLDTNPENYSEIKHYLRKSFSIGDNRYISQFWYARTLYLAGELQEANERFESLYSSKVNFETKTKTQGIIIEKSKPKIFSGTITRVETTYGFIQRDDRNESIFFNPNENSENWHLLMRGKKVIFHIGFNYRGAIAIHLDSPK